MVSSGPMFAVSIAVHCDERELAPGVRPGSQLSIFSLESRGGVGAAGKGVPIGIASLRSGCSQGWEVLTIKRGKGEGIVISGKVKCRPMGRAVEGCIERAERDDEEASKERQGFSKHRGIEPTS